VYIHLGGEKIIRSAELVAIFDISSEKTSDHLQQLTAHATKQIETISDEESKSLVVTKSKIFYSPISSTTLKRRASIIY